MVKNMALGLCVVISHMSVLNRTSPLVPAHWPSICKAWDTIQPLIYRWDINHAPYMKYYEKKKEKKKEKKRQHYMTRRLAARVITGQHDNSDAFLQKPVTYFPVIQIDMYGTPIFSRYHTCQYSSLLSPNVVSIAASICSALFKYNKDNVICLGFKGRSTQKRASLPEEHTSKNTPPIDLKRKHSRL